MIILPYQAAQKIVEKYPNKLNVISISNDNAVVDPSLCLNHIQIKMDDIDTWHIERFKKDLLEKGMIFPEKHHVEEAIAFSRKNKVHIVHCHAGLSRSPAIAYAILRDQGLTKPSALAKVKEIAPESEPNMRVVKLTDEIYGE